MTARAIALAALTLGMSAALPGCGSEPEEQPVSLKIAPAIPVPPASGPRDIAVVEVRNFGEFRIELLDDVAPRTVENFVELAERHFYRDTTFHRVIPGFAIQGGDPNSRNRDPRDDGRGGPGYSIEDEFSELSHLRGVVSMANSGRANSAGSQFFVVLDAARPLDGKYAAFGHVVEGMDVVDRIARVERDQYGRRGPRDRPVENVVIQSVRIERGAGGVEVAVETEAELDAAPENEADAGEAQASAPSAGLGGQGIRWVVEEDEWDAGPASRLPAGLPARADPEPR